MAFVNVEASFTIYDSYSLKDKRSTVKSLIERLSKRHNVSMAEVGNQDMLNVSTIGIACVNSSSQLARKMVEKVLAEMEEQYEIEIFDIHWYE